MSCRQSTSDNATAVAAAAAAALDSASRGRWMTNEGDAGIIDARENALIIHFSRKQSESVYHGNMAEQSKPYKVTHLGSPIPSESR